MPYPLGHGASDVVAIQLLITAIAASHATAWHQVADAGRASPGKCHLGGGAAHYAAQDKRGQRAFF